MFKATWRTISIFSAEWSFGCGRSPHGGMISIVRLNFWLSTYAFSISFGAVSIMIHLFGRSVYLLMDRSWEGDAMRALAEELGYIPMVQPKSGRKDPWNCAWEALIRSPRPSCRQSPSFETFCPQSSPQGDQRNTRRKSLGVLAVNVTGWLVAGWMKDNSLAWRHRRPMGSVRAPYCLSPATGQPSSFICARI